MEYLPGEKLDYRRDLEAAAGVFARIHSLQISAEDNPLIREERPLSMTHAECARMLRVYLESELAGPLVRDYLSMVMAWAAEARGRSVISWPIPGLASSTRR